MEERLKEYELDSGEKIRSLDDLPELAKLAKRQLFLNKWYKPLAMAPFAVFIFLDQVFFPKSRSPILIAMMIPIGIWVMSLVGYSFYLLLFLRCPYCSSVYGLGDRCKACGLPRHPDPTSAELSDLPSRVSLD